MTDDRSGRPRPALEPQRRLIKLIVLAVVVLLALAWVGSWLLYLDVGVLPAALAAVVAAAIAVTGIRVALARQQRNPDTASNLLGMRAPSSLGDERAGAGYRPVAEPDQIVNPGTNKHWSLDVFAAIDAQRFAAVCETWFSWAGFDTRSGSHRTVEGVDIWLHAAKLPGPVAIVRCKHRLNKPVEIQEMIDFLGEMATFKSAHGTYTTTSTYTPEALQFAKDNGIDAVDGRGLLRRFKTRTRQSQQALLAVAYSGQS